MSKNIIITDMPIKTDRGDVTRTVSACFNEKDCEQLIIHDSSSVIGNIYLGRIENIVKNISSAFVITDKDNTCYYSLTDNRRHYFFNPKNNDKPNQGDSVLVQVDKDATKLKPASVTSKVELAGFALVLSLDVVGVAVSKKIRDNELIQKLKCDLEQLIDDSLQSDIYRETGITFGFIIRTNCISINDTYVVLKEARKLIDEMTDIIKTARYSKAPKLIRSANPEFIGLIDDMVLGDVDGIITDLPDVYEQIDNRYRGMFGENAPKLRLYEDKLLALYNLYDVRKELEKALSRKVWLKSGGYIIIDYTEACTVIDVNSGKYVTKKNDVKAREEAAFTVNLQAACEIAKQLRLRNISGMIIVDFINMKERDNEERLLELLRENFARDKTTTRVVDMTKLGLVEITRKREGAMLHEHV